jgi:Na+/melibiose symporter-like transporter
MELEKTKTNKRTLNVLVMFFSFIMLPWSGLLLHTTHGRMEREVLRHFAMTVHNIAAIIFLITCVLHIIVNRKALTKYLLQKTAEFSSFKKEALIALVLVLGIIGLVSMHVFHLQQ